MWVSPNIKKPAVDPEFNALRGFAAVPRVLFESTAIIVDGHGGEALLAQVEQVNTSVTPLVELLPVQPGAAPFAATVRFVCFTSNVVCVLSPWLSNM